ncbi:MAG TPA: NfeD family protein [Halobacteriales archaeon]|nr:NfeD family protein [Halobacteriales archaeon]
MVVPLDLSLPLLLVLIGVGLVVAEAFAPGAHFIVLGVALLGAGLAGLVMAAFLPALVGGLLGTFLLALLVLVFGGAALYVYREYDLYGGTGVGKTRDSDSLRGLTGRVTERVTETEGQVKLGRGGFNPYYAARTTDGEIAEGEEVIVVDPGGGNVVTVESIGMVEDDIERELARGRAREAQAEAEAETEREEDG